jgi:hypothetical protein
MSVLEVLTSVSRIASIQMVPSTVAADLVTSLMMMGVAVTVRLVLQYQSSVPHYIARSILSSRCRRVPQSNSHVCPDLPQHCWLLHLRL